MQLIFRPLLGLTFCAYALALGCGDAPRATVDSGLSIREDGGSAPDAAADGGGELDGGTEDECVALWRSMTDWVESHRACDGAGQCERITSPTIPDNGPVCAFEAVPGEDLGALEELTAQYQAAGCGGASASCSVEPGFAVCRAGQCVLEDTFDDCLRCLEGPAEPVCTVGGRNARNRCAAAACFREEVASEGYCPDAATCVMEGGSCHWQEQTTARCPDGMRHDLFELERGCAGGHFIATCCVPYDSPCTYFGGTSFALSVDPFTCRTRPSCISGVQGDRCDYDADVYLNGVAAGAEAADVQVTAGLGRQVVVEGTRAADGVSFRCEGEVGDEGGTLSPSWSCEACAGGDCRPCTATHTGLCQL